MSGQDPEQVRTTGEQWLSLCSRLKERFGKQPDLNAVLFLIGVQELGKLQKKFSKEEKQDLMHVATCRILPEYYRLERYDDEGWPHFILRQPLPAMELQQQEDFLKEHVIRYFEQAGY